MKQISDTQEFARRFNEEEAIWQRCQGMRRSREADSPTPESILDHFDWLAAEHETRITRVVARTLTSAPS